MNPACVLWTAIDYYINTIMSMECYKFNSDDYRELWSAMKCYGVL